MEGCVRKKVQHRLTFLLMESENEVSAKGQTVHEDNACVAKDI